MEGSLATSLPEEIPLSLLSYFTKLYGGGTSNSNTINIFLYSSVQLQYIHIEKYQNGSSRPAWPAR